MRETVDVVELLWTTSSAIAFVSSWVVWRWSRSDWIYAKSVGRWHIARSFLEDVRNARWRVCLSAAIMAAGVVAMTQPAMTPHRTAAGWIIVALLFAAPIQVVVRNLSEASTRRSILRDVERAERSNGRTAR